MSKRRNMFDVIYKMIIGAFGVLILCWSQAPGAILQNSAGRSQATIDQHKAEILEKIKQAPQVPIRFVNAKRAPLSIVESSSKEISGAEYYDLVGLTTVSETLASFPDVRIINNTVQRVTAFILILKNEQTNKMHAIKASGIKIEPYGKYIIAAHRWVRPDKEGRAVTGGSNTAIKTKSTPGWDSERMWHLGKATDLVVRVGSVEFEDGTKWKIEDSDVSSTRPGVQFSRAGFFTAARYSPSFAIQPVRNMLYSCVCFCGVTCHRDGSQNCSADAGSCTSYPEFVECVDNAVPLLLRASVVVAEELLSLCLHPKYNCWNTENWLKRGRFAPVQVICALSVRRKLNIIQLESYLLPNTPPLLSVSRLCCLK